MLHTEALFLINDQKPKVFELQVISQNPVSADHNVHQSPLRILHGLLLLCGSPETAHQIYTHREILHPLQKRVVVLLRQDGRWHQIDHLLILLHRLERRPDGNLCFPVSYVPADQTVHNLSALHIPLHSLDGKKLILRLLKGKHFLEFLLPDRILPVYIAFLLLSCGVELHQILRNLFYRSPDPCLRFVPLLGSQPVQPRLLSVRTGILLYQIQLGCRNIQIAALCIGNLHIILGNLIYHDLLNALVDSQPVILVHHVIPGL